MPTSSSTGEVHEIVFAQPLRSLELTVQMGDEVRWVNELEGEVHIVFLDPIDDKVDCQRGFGLIDVTNATILSPRNSASLCFSKPGSVRYTVRMDQPPANGEMNALGIIRIEQNRQAS
jgi:hypothetical protein